MTFTLSFDQRALAEIAQMYGFGVLLSEEVGQAMTEAGALLQQAAVDNTWQVFEHPTGQLASTIRYISDSPYEVQIGSDSPYARRREYGFSGMTDSLGRTFAHDPGKPYMQPALDDNRNAVLSLIDAGVERAIARIGGA